MTLISYKKVHDNGDVTEDNRTKDKQSEAVRAIIKGGCEFLIW